MSVLNENQLLGASGAGGDYEIEQSLRFDDGAYLSRTPSSAGNRKTFTYSVWIKRSKLSDQQRIFGASSSSSHESSLHIYQDKVEFFNYLGSSPYPVLTTTQVFRDTSAWYHLVIVVDTTNSTQGDRLRMYLNGERVTAFSQEVYPALNYEYVINESGISHLMGLRPTNLTNPFSGYMGEVNFIDGLALTPDSFGETGDYGEWKAKSYAGTYGTNGFFLPFKQDYAVEGFSTVVYEGNGATQYIGGTGFQPDFVWIKDRVGTDNHHLFDAIRGTNQRLISNLTAAENTESNALNSFDTDGFTLGSNTGVNANTENHVAWNWDMGGTTASNTNGSITSSVRANTTYGQSIVSYTGTGSNATIGHGLASAPTMVITKRRDSVGDWDVWHTGLGNGTKYIILNTTQAVLTASNIWNSTVPSSTVVSLGTHSSNNASSGTYIAYCFQMSQATANLVHTQEMAAPQGQ